MTAAPVRLATDSATSLTSGRGDQEGDVKHVVTEGRVGCDVDALLLAVLNQVVALQDRVTLNLVGGGHNASALNNSLELCEGQYGL